MNENILCNDYLKQEGLISEEIKQLETAEYNNNNKLALLYNSRGLAKYMQESFDQISYAFKQEQYISLAAQISFDKGGGGNQK